MCGSRVKVCTLCTLYVNVVDFIEIKMVIQGLVKVVDFRHFSHRCIGGIVELVFKFEHNNIGSGSMSSLSFTSPFMTRWTNM